MMPDLTSLVVNDFIGEQQNYPLPNYYTSKEISQNRSPKKPHKQKQMKTVLTLEPFRNDFTQDCAVIKLREILGIKKKSL